MPHPCSNIFSMVGAVLALSLLLGYRQSYGTDDGIPTIEYSVGLQPSGSKTSDGQWWLPTSKELVVVDSHNAGINQAMPPVVIERLLVDDRVVFEGTAALPIQISPGRHRFEFQYACLSFINPDRVRFKYRLSGLEAGWRDAQQNRVAYYDYIPPGKYVFQVIACNSDGVWNEAGAKMNFTVLPYFWQTWWFRILGGGVILAVGGCIIWYDTHRRLRFQVERIEWQQAIANERSRIARDIHDDLGATLTRITMISENVRSGAHGPQEAEADFKQIYDITRELTRAMDEIVWAVNPKHDTLESLVNYIQKFAQDFLNTAKIRCRLDMPLQIPAWPLTAEKRHNLFLAFKEALNNVVKHASASQVLISLVLIKAEAFKLSVEDDGCGFSFDSNANKLHAGSPRYSSGNGLENMTRRLAQIGGSFDVTSTQTKGTKVIFTVALK
jgi:signal transduction histidine kinase